MVHESMRNLKFDRRFVHRHGWLDAKELEEYLASLPDVAEKAEVVGAEPGSDGSAGGAGTSPGPFPERD